VKYAQILSKIRESYWLITPEGLDVVLSIVDKHVNTEGVVEVNMAEVRSVRSARGERELNVQRGIGILPLTGPIFGKANMMTELSGATSLEMFSKDLDTLLADDSVSSILLQIDSPGGTSDLVHEVGDQIFAGRAEKPIYAISDTMAGSAAYWLGSHRLTLYTQPCQDR
jgi:ClpP class serine protease